MDSANGRQNSDFVQFLPIRATTEGSGVKVQVTPIHCPDSSILETNVEAASVDLFVSPPRMNTKGRFLWSEEGADSTTGTTSDAGGRGGGKS